LELNLNLVMAAYEGRSCLIKDAAQITLLNFNEDTQARLAPFAS